VTRNAFNHEAARLDEGHRIQAARNAREIDILEKLASAKNPKSIWNHEKRQWEIPA